VGGSQGYSLLHGLSLHPVRVGRSTSSPAVGQVVSECFGIGHGRRFRVNFVPTIRATIRLFKPFLDTVIAENVLALREAERVFLDALWICDTKLVIADDTS